MNDRGFYDWRGHPVEAEFFKGGWDVSVFTTPAEHPTGEVPAGETHALVEFIGTDRGFWIEESIFFEEAKPLIPNQRGLQG